MTKQLNVTLVPSQLFSRENALPQVHSFLPIVKVRASVEESVRSMVEQHWETTLRETEEQHHSQLETLQNTHTAQLTYVLCTWYVYVHGTLVVEMKQ